MILGQRLGAAVLCALLFAAFPVRSTAGDRSTGTARTLDFEDDRAYAHLRAYMDLSPIHPGSSASSTFFQVAKSHLEPLGFTVEADEWQGAESPGPLRNIVASRGTGQRIHMVGAHYDTRIWADKDPEASRRRDPVPGANDGGSGVAVLLELARAVNQTPDSTLRLAFFDAEDQGGILGYSGWILGSTRMASRLTAEERGRIAEVIVVDIVGDPELRLIAEGNSDPSLAARIWGLAGELGYGETFLPGAGFGIVDDHVPFKQLGLPVIDLIQLQGLDGSSFFTWHHTTLDTIDRVSRVSLGRVGRTLEAFLESVPPTPTAAGLFLRRGAAWPLAGVAILVILGMAVVIRHRRRQRIGALAPARQTSRHALRQGRGERKRRKR